MKTLRAPSMFDPLVTRDSLPAFMASLGYETMVEIGTYRGEFAEHVLKNWGGKLTCVDPWSDLPQAVYHDGCFTLNNITPLQAYAETLQRLDPWIKEGRCVIERKTSVDAAKSFTSGSLDVVYLDGAHDEKTVATEIALYWPLIKSGGLLGSHDCYTRADSFQSADVANAVWDHAEKIGTRPRITPDGSAWFVKP